MLHRARSWLVSALLPLALLFALPHGSELRCKQASSIEPRADAGAVVANSPLNRQQSASGWTRWTDEEDDSGPIAQATATWAPVTSSARPTRASDPPPLHASGLR